jgi:hypothetical protein
VISKDLKLSARRATIAESDMDAATGPDDRQHAIVADIGIDNAEEDRAFEKLAGGAREQIGADFETETWRICKGFDHRNIGCSPC